ncbi:neutral/alkaline non-lysosomal ceramidase N-terminal domain-containing protein [Victivallis sp. Marseille-Q1083]|uniref:neutral/alkaline non-lysosomal ceramidase N-terminal domain-containing protein n=1 Tax=Victivallis sp. Marseille-Q1083 TaxID=2717288 RepID=UPI00158D54DC|nr:neutral/alkaline non-lysosomal ceramidase N-terminal domain-containing protein [Victivallis sp. Marseille-Q1083]
MKELLIGWGETDITPADCRIELSGQYYQRVACGVHSRLKAVAVALQQGAEKLALLALDVADIPAALQREIRELVRTELPDLPPERLVVNATHTHNAPYTSPKGIFEEWMVFDPDLTTPAQYLDLLRRQAAAAVRQAWQTRRPGGVAAAFGRVPIGHCRRAVYADGSAEMYGDTGRADFTGLESGEESGVEMLFTCDNRKQLTGMLLNVCCPAQVMEATELISSDYLGAVRELLKEALSPEFHTLCQIGAAGCQSPRDLLRRNQSEPDGWHADTVQYLAGKLAPVVTAAAWHLGTLDFTPVFRVRQARPQLPLRPVSAADFALAQTELARLAAGGSEEAAFAAFCRETRDRAALGGPGPYDDKLHDFSLIQNHKATVAHYRRRQREPLLPAELTAFRIGSSAWVTVPFELFLTYGQIIQARSAAAQTAIVQLAAGYYGYLPSPEAERHGGYGGLVINGPVGSDGGKQLVEAALDLIQRLMYE